MKIRIVQAFVIVLVFFARQGLAQTASNHITYFLYGAFGKSVIISNPSLDGSRYAVREGRIGMGASKPIGDGFSLFARLDVGVKARRGRRIRGTMYGLPWDKPLYVSRKNHLFVELPVAVRYKIPATPFAIHVGGSTRYFLDEPKFNRSSFSTRWDVGVLMGAIVTINRKINLGFEYNLGMTKALKNIPDSNGAPTDYYAKNRYGQIALEYKLGQMLKP